jgi:hypothetical protein
MGSIHLPTPILPKALDIPQMYLKQPTADVPAYKPMVIPPADLERPPETKAEETETTETPEPPKLQIPVLDIQMPIPETAVVVTAATTAVVAVATTTVAQTFFEPIQKQIKKQLQKRVDAWKKKRKEKKEKVSSVS